MRVKIQEQFKNGMMYGDKIHFYCKNKEKKCSYTVEAHCRDGTIEIPSCFKGKAAMGCLVGIPLGPGYHQPVMSDFEKLSLAGYWVFKKNHGDGGNQIEQRATYSFLAFCFPILFINP